MAKVVFSAIVADIRGRLGSSVYSFCRGTHYIKSYQPDVYQPNTPRQVFTKGNFQYYSGLWYGLPNTYKQMWRQYASLIGGRMTGYNAFMKHNLRLSAAYHSDLTYILYPPQTVQTVKFPFGISVSASDSVTNVINWTVPTDISTYIQLFYILEWNYASGYNRHWSFVETLRADSGSFTHVHDYPISTVMYYRLRSIDKQGRISPYTHTINVTVPS